MRNPVRKFVGVALVGVLGALFALPMLAAGAQEVGSADVAGRLHVHRRPAPSPATVSGSGDRSCGCRPRVGGHLHAQCGSRRAHRQVLQFPAPAGRRRTFAFTFHSVTVPGLVTANFRVGNRQRVP